MYELNSIQKFDDAKWEKFGIVPGLGERLSGGVAEFYKDKADSAALHIQVHCLHCSYSLS